MTNRNTELTDIEREFIDKATSNKYAEYLVQTKIIERLPHLFKRYRYLVSIMLFLTIMALTGFGIFQWKQFENIKSAQDELDRIKNNAIQTIDNLERKTSDVDGLISRFGETNTSLNNIVTTHTGLQNSQNQLLEEKGEIIDKLDRVLQDRLEIVEEKNSKLEEQLNRTIILADSLEKLVNILNNNSLIDAAKTITKYYSSNLGSSFTLTLPQKSGSTRIKPPGSKNAITISTGDIDDESVIIILNGDRNTVKPNEMITKVFDNEIFEITLSHIQDLKKSNWLAIITINYKLNGL